MGTGGVLYILGLFAVLGSYVAQAQQMVPLPEDIASTDWTSQDLFARPPKTFVEFCAQTDEIPGIALERLKVRANRFEFTNSNLGGYFDRGLCWWHSLFQLHAAHLTYYDPLDRKPSRHVAIDLIKAIRKGERAVRIPGYGSFYEFSKDWKDEIAETLADWQRDSTLHHALRLTFWEGTDKVKAETLWSMMETLAEQIDRDQQPVYQMLNHEGMVGAHSWIVVDADIIDEKAVLRVIDSRSTTIKTFTVKKGDTHLNDYSFGDYVPYTQNEDRIDRLERTAHEYCRSRGMSPQKDPENWDFVRHRHLSEANANLFTQLDYLWRRDLEPNSKVLASTVRMTWRLRYGIDDVAIYLRIFEWMAQNPTRVKRMQTKLENFLRPVLNEHFDDLVYFTVAFLTNDDPYLDRQREIAAEVLADIRPHRRGELRVILQEEYDAVVGRYSRKSRVSFAQKQLRDLGYELGLVLKERFM